MLILASAAVAKILTLGFDATSGRLDDSQQPRPAESLFDLNQLNLNFFTERNKWNEDHEIVRASDPFAAEGNIDDGDNQLLTRDR